MTFWLNFKNSSNSKIAQVIVFFKKLNGSPNLKRFTYIFNKIIKSSWSEVQFPVEPIQPADSVQFW